MMLYHNILYQKALFFFYLDLGVKIRFFANNSKTVEVSKVLKEYYCSSSEDGPMQIFHDSSPDVGVMAPETEFFFVLHAYNIEKLLLWNHATKIY